MPIISGGEWKDCEADRWARRAVLGAEILSAAAAIVRDVEERGDAAIVEHTERLDGVRLEAVRVPMDVLDASLEAVDQEWLRILSDAAANIRQFHERQLPRSWMMDDGDGVRLGQRVVPMQRVGLYVPGGTASYPSSVLMTAIPAQVAGVPEICVASPPCSSGFPSPQVMAASRMLGLAHVFAVGGAQAVGALAYGTASVPRVDKIVGPGNVYVTAAKKYVYGTVDIDALAGPSEVVVLADHSAPSSWIACDLVAQAEHDSRASSILVTTDAELAREVQRHIRRIVPESRRQGILEASLTHHSMIIVVDNLETGMAIINDLAPEHLQIMIENPDAVLTNVLHAGAVFVGPHSPEPVGDYYAGPNHVLPTGGTARFASALGVEDYVRRQSIIHYTAARLKKTASAIAMLARAEALPAHARSVEVRLQSPVVSKDP